MREFFKNLNSKRVSSDTNLAESTKIIIKNGEIPILFESIEEFDTRILAGITSSRQLLAKALGALPEELSDKLTLAYEKPLPLTEVKDAPFLANHFKNPDILKYIPVPKFYGDKRYLTASIVISKHPETSRRNSSFHRMMYLEKNKFLIRPVPQRDLDNFYRSALEMGKDYLDIIIVIGVHPVFELAAATSYPDLDELELASRLLGGANEYILNGIGVPSDAEIVMVGKMLNEEGKEGPFIDLTGTEDIVRLQPVVEISDLYMRDSPIFRTILPGRKEHKMLMGIPQEPRIKKMMMNTLPTVKQVIMTEGGGSWLHAVVQIKKRTAGDGKNAIISALAAHPSLKRVIIVDEDVDPTNPVDVEWAIATRFQPDKDMILIPGAKGSSLDPSAEKEGTTCKWGLDCTKLLGSSKYEKII